jgi:hypothetical protein
MEKDHGVICCRCRWPSEDVRLEVAMRSDVMAMPYPLAIADKTLDTDGQTPFLHRSRQLQASPEKCFPGPAGVQGFFVQGFADACSASCRQCLHKVGLDFLAQFCGLSLSVPHHQKADP